MNSAVPSQISRRMVLRQIILIAAQTSLMRGLPQVAVTGLLLGHVKNAFAEPVTVGLAVASTVAGMIASQNQSDGGLAATLKASLEYQRALTKQLVSVQEGLALVVRKLDNMEASIQAMLHQERVKSLQSDIGTQILRYQHEISTRASTFPTYGAWLKNRETQETLRDISNQLETAVTRVQQERWFDSLTALYLCTAAFAALGVRAARGEENAQLKAEGQRYLDLFSFFENAAEAGTIAFDSAHSNELISAATKELTAQLGIPALPRVGRQELITVGEVGVKDNTPPPPMTDECVPKNRDCRQPSYKAFEFRSAISSIFQTEKNAQGGSIEVLQYALTPAQAVASAKDGKTITQRTSIRAATEADYQKAADDSMFLKSAQEKVDRFKGTADKLNIALAKQVLDGTTLIALSATRQRIVRHFGKEL